MVASARRAPVEQWSPLSAQDGPLSVAVTPNDRFAFVTLAFDPPGAAFGQLWSVLPMAHAISELSAYPLVVLTNTTHFPDGQETSEVLGRLGAQAVSPQHVPIPESVLHEYRYMPCQERTPPVCEYQFLKLQIWRLTQFDKLIWLDTDSLVARNLDFMFWRPGTWAQQDNWDCGSTLRFVVRNSHFLTHLVDSLERLLPPLWSPGEVQAHNACSGLLVLEPSLDTYEGMVKFMSEKKSIPGGDQEVVQNYFAEVMQEPVRLVSPSVASFGQCVGTSIPGGAVPAFVHKSEWENNCFQMGAKASQCSSKLALTWRRHFCEALRKTGLHVTGEPATYCSAEWERLA